MSEQANKEAVDAYMRAFETDWREIKLSEESRPMSFERLEYLSQVFAPAGALTYVERSACNGRPRVTFNFCTWHTRDAFEAAMVVGFFNSFDHSEAHPRTVRLESDAGEGTDSFTVKVEMWRAGYLDDAADDGCFKIAGSLRDLRHYLEVKRAESNLCEVELETGHFGVDHEIGRMDPALLRAKAALEEVRQIE